MVRLECPCKDCKIRMVHNQGCIRAYQHINTYCNQQVAWGKMLLLHHLICGTECSSNSPLSDRSSEQILELGMDFKTWGLHTALWVSLCPQQELLPTLFHVCALQVRTEHTTESWRLTELNFSPEISLLSRSPNSCDFTGFHIFLE